MKTVVRVAMALVLATGVLYGEAAGQAPPLPSQEQPEVLTRGPINEAFAKPVNLEDQPGLIAPTAPPAYIEEIAPPERPAGDQYSWVPGYWAWDTDRDGYIWVSGCWRVAPPGMYWVPGYWANAAAGWQWVEGFWTPDSHQEIEYLPAPPALTDVDPYGSAPSPDLIWVPPCWYWYRGQYVRRPGYWLAAQVDWVWVPSNYVWTPRGYVFVNGHWDYPLARRGVLFAPVYFPRRLYGRPGFSYTLSIAVDIGNLEFGLFTRPQYGHYYFGDYYDSVYIGIGIFPWFEFERRHTWYDPIYVNDRWRHRKEGQRWEQHQRQEYDRRRADKTLRVPGTYREMARRASKMPESQRKNFEIAAPMTRVARGKTTDFKFEQSTPQAQKKISRHAADAQKFVKERSAWESQSGGRAAARPPKKREGVPLAEGRQKASPATPKGPAAGASPRVAPAPAERAGGGGAVARPPKKHEGVPAAEGRQKASSVTPKGPAAGASPRETKYHQPDKMKIRTPPVAGKKGGGSSRKGTPSRPTGESVY